MMSFSPPLASFVMMGYTIHVIKQAHPPTTERNPP
nr:MAG TPA: hypothetical protein [Caudoviricetes sp.]